MIHDHDPKHEDHGPLVYELYKQQGRDRRTVSRS